VGAAGIVHASGAGGKRRASSAGPQKLSVLRRLCCPSKKMLSPVTCSTGLVRNSAKLGWSGFATRTPFWQARMGDPIQGIRHAFQHASLVVDDGDAAPAKPGAKTKGVGQGSGAPTSPPPPLEHESNAADRTTAETTIKEANKNQPSYKYFQLTP